ncbi:hypothetical protein HK104_007269, partial [Borealophlyctis nickersoniae]
GEEVEGLGWTFLHGIASGDPLSDSVILWTKVTPPSPSFSSPIGVRYEVSATTTFVEVDTPYGRQRQLRLGPVIQHGDVVTGPEVDYTVKVDVRGLEPSTKYFYRFLIPGTPPVYSPLGQTRTLPSAEEDIEHLTLAVVSCSNAAMGFFNSYGNIATREEVDVVVHLGDYIYEYADGEFGYGAPIGRTPEPNVNLRTLHDYRTRHAQYKRDPDLQAAHAAHPWIVIWDDHEFADNIDGRPEHAARVAAGMRAYFEYLPIRERTVDRDGRIYRTFQFGRLVDLVMLDTRIVGRDETDLRSWSLISNPNRTILGDVQEQWFKTELTKSQHRGAHWRFIGNQVVFSPLHLMGHPVGVDSWDGYPAARARIVEHIRGEGIGNVVFLTGEY